MNSSQERLHYTSAWERGLAKDSSPERRRAHRKCDLEFATVQVIRPRWDVRGSADRPNVIKHAGFSVRNQLYDRVCATRMPGPFHHNLKPPAARFILSHMDVFVFFSAFLMSEIMFNVFVENVNLPLYQV